MVAASEPFAALLDIAERSLRSAQGLPAQVDIKPQWTGIGFMLAGRRFVAPMSEVAEILSPPPVTRLPGVQKWVRGVANVRGRLLPLIDLEAFFGGSLAGSRKHHRVLALELGELYSGLVVSEVFGMQHFPVDTFQQALTDDVAPFAAFLGGSYELEGQRWTVFSPFMLARNPAFYDAAAG